MMIKEKLWKWFGDISTVFLLAAALFPRMLGISDRVHPWIFVVAVAWVFLFVAGFFR